jgi:hypothetical protein
MWHPAYHSPWSEPAANICTLWLGCDFQGPLRGGAPAEEAFVVPEASARGENFNFNVVAEADHFSVCRPKSKIVRSFRKLQEFVSEIASNATDAEVVK